LLTLTVTASDAEPLASSSTATAMERLFRPEPP
jgi:hypothetical protein